MKRAPIRKLPDRDLLDCLLSYDPQTGILVWKERRPENRAAKAFNARFAGKPAGTISVGRDDGSNRYLVIGMRPEGRYQQYQAHRLIWKMMTGNDPPEFIDHVDGNCLNNMWENLRAASNGQNIQNAKRRRDNKSGVKGVCWDAAQKKWRAYISIGVKQRKLGRFDRLADAVAAVDTERAKLHGAYARAA